MANRSRNSSPSTPLGLAATFVRDAVDVDESVRRQFLDFCAVNDDALLRMVPNRGT